MADLTRRTFLGAAGLAAGLSRVSTGDTPEAASTGRESHMGSSESIRELVWKTPLVDTHEHLWEEKVRLEATAEKSSIPAPDFGMLMMHYTDSDLQVSGMPPAEYQKLRAYGIEPREKWRIVAP